MEPPQVGTLPLSCPLREMQYNILKTILLWPRQSLTNIAFRGFGARIKLWRVSGKSTLEWLVIAG